MDTSQQEQRAGEATEAVAALHAGGRQRRRVKEDPSWGKTSQAAVTITHLHTGHGQHRCAGEDSTLGRVAEVQGMTEALPTRHPQPQSTRKELIREGTEEALRES